MSDSLTVGVTGAGGYLGSRTTRALLDAGHEVVPVDNGFNAAVTSVAGVEVLDVDVRNREALEDVFGDVDAVCHLAAYSGLDECDADPDGAFETNVQGTANVGWVCRQHEIPLSFAGSVAVYGEPETFPIQAEYPRDPMNHYGWTKAVNEADISWLTHDVFPAHVMNMANLYGRHTVDGTTLTKQNVIEIFASRAVDGDPLVVYEPGTQARNWVHVADVADAYVRSVETLVDADPGARTYLLATDDVCSVLEIAEAVVAATETVHGRTPTLERRTNPRDEALAPDFSMDWEAIRSDLGWEPTRTVEGTIREMIDT